VVCIAYIGVVVELQKVGVVVGVDVVVGGSGTVDCLFDGVA